MIKKFLQSLFPYDERRYSSKASYNVLMKKASRRLEKKIKELLLSFILIVIAVSFFLWLLFLAPGQGYYAPDGYDATGKLVDTDGDGDYYHWEEYK